MSWGERSCKWLYPEEKTETKHCDPTIETCNVDCKLYESNGKSKDSTSRRGALSLAAMAGVLGPEALDKVFQQNIKKLCVQLSRATIMLSGLLPVVTDIDEKMRIAQFIESSMEMMDEVAEARKE